MVSVIFEALLLTGWGGVAYTASGPVPSSAPGAVRLTASVSLKTCLKAHGVRLPKHFAGPKGPSHPKDHTPPKDAKKFTVAFKACGALGGFHFGGTFARGSATGSAIRAYLSCLSDNGVHVPKKDRKHGKLTGLSTRPKFPVANKKCSVLLPAGRGTTGT